MDNGSVVAFHMLHPKDILQLRLQRSYNPTLGVTVQVMSTLTSYRETMLSRGVAKFSLRVDRRAQKIPKNACSPSGFL